jgi:hypothetical protein
MSQFVEPARPMIEMLIGFSGRKHIDRPSNQSSFYFFHFSAVRCNASYSDSLSCLAKSSFLLSVIGGDKKYESDGMFAL